jgi:ABC-type phosphate/phosphonate transport system ATPase subunit
MRHIEYAEYAQAVAALEPVLDARDGKVIAIGGWPHSGKTTLGRYLAWQFNVSLIETDMFILPNQGGIVHREDEVARVVEHRIGGAYPNPVIIEGATILKLLARLNVKPDFTIYVERPVDHEAGSLATELESYHNEFRPGEAADLVLMLPEDD